MKRSRKEETLVGNNRKIVTRSMSKKQKKPDDEVDENNSVFLPLDLIITIVAKLPPKSIAKFIFLSKLWLPIIRSEYFTGLFLTRSLTRPCFLFTFQCGKDRLFHSASQESPSSRTQSRACTTLDQDYRVSAAPVRGLICLHNASKMVICNPTTGQVAALPNIKTRRRGISCFLGYDCVEGVHKVLCMTTVLNAGGPVASSEHQVLTLGRGRRTWRMIPCPKHPHCPATKGLCKDGVVYYGAWSNTYRQGSQLVCFDFRQEVFSVVKLPESVGIQVHPRTELVNYHTKLALVVNQSYSGGGHVELWVLEDVEKQEWSRIIIVVPYWKDLVGHSYFRCMGTISTDGFIFAPHSLHDPYPYFVVYYDRKEGKATRVEIEGVGDSLPGPVTFFLDHVESLMLL